MPNVHLTKTMQDFADAQIEAGAYANLSEVVRAGMRTLMEKDLERAYYELKVQLNEIGDAVERGEYVEFDPREFEPDAFR
jgi:antitoxin ParD1/3/4